MILDDIDVSSHSTMMADRRLELLFACAHPAIDEGVRAPLMLQVVFGLDANAIAGLFLMTPTAMSQRLVRAKQKIRDARIPFQIPDSSEYSARLQFVLMAIYALYTRDAAVWHEPSATRDSLADEAVWLGHVVVQLSHRDPEALGLQALMLFAESRRTARRDRGGCFVPLLDQDTALWDAELIGRAENLLREAARGGMLGRFQLEAAIQSAHAARAMTGTTDWHAIVTLYEGLLAIAPTPAARINRAVALLHLDDTDAALAALDDLARDARVLGYQPYWAARAHVLQSLGHVGDALSCYDLAIALEADEGARDFLARKRQSLRGRQI